MRHTHSLSKRSGIAVSLRLFGWSRSIVVWPLCVLLTATSTSAQTMMLSTPKNLLATEPRAFAHWLETVRPMPVSAVDRERILASLPVEGEVTKLNDAARRKLAAMKPLLRAMERELVYEIKVYNSPLARTGLYERTVVLISEATLTLTDEHGLQALIAHDIAHEYIWFEHERATRLHDYRRLKELELLCDAIAIVILHELGVDPSRLITTVEKLTRHNQKFPGATVDESGYPSLSERRAFARAVILWMTNMRPKQSSR